MKKIFFSIIIYIFLIIISFGMPYSFTETAFIKKFINLSALIENKAIYMSQNLYEANLALNYLGNIRKLSFYEASIFQNSGLMHLLAISGAQVVPLAQGLSSLIGIILYITLNKKIKPQKLMIIINHIKNIKSLTISFIICSTFGCSGALIRVVGLNYLSNFQFIKQQYIKFFKLFPYILSNTFNRLVVISFMLFYFGNVFINFSFLLSAIGATSAEFSLILSKKVINNNFIFQSISSTILTSLFIGIIFFPFSQTNIYNSCLSNILASPIVGLLITPLSLLALILPDNIFFYDYIILYLDYSLFLLKKIAIYFNNSTNIINPFEKSNILFTNIGVFYLNSILILIWILSDFLKEKKLTIFKNKFIAS